MTANVGAGKGMVENGLIVFEGFEMFFPGKKRGESQESKEQQYSDGSEPHMTPLDPGWREDGGVWARRKVPVDQVFT
jgi:hypothetical protein